MRPSHRFTTSSLRARAQFRFILFTLFSCCLFLYISLHLYIYPFLSQPRRFVSSLAVGCTVLPHFYATITTEPKVAAFYPFTRYATLNRRMSCLREKLPRDRCFQRGNDPHPRRASNSNYPISCRQENSRILERDTGIRNRSYECLSLGISLI